MIEKYLVVVDTNILFHHNKHFVVNPDFDKFWDEYNNKVILNLFVPEVVEGELLYQQVTSALKTFEKANNAIKSLSLVADKKYKNTITEAKIISDIKKRFNKWKNKIKAKNIKTPINNISWENIVDSSIWRKPPFSIDSKNNNSEKGFRDSLILETVCDFSDENTDNNIIFICNDSLLRETAEARMDMNINFSAYSSINEFESYLRLISEEFESKLIKSLTNKAKMKFFTYNDTSTLVYRDKLIKKIREKYSDELSNPQEILRLDYHDEDILTDVNVKSIGGGKYTIVGKPEFIKRKNGNEFFWKSVVRYKREYEIFDGLFDSNNYLYNIMFYVDWKVNISSNSIFTKMSIIDIELDDMTIEEQHE